MRSVRRQREKNVALNAFGATTTRPGRGILEEPPNAEMSRAAQAACLHADALRGGGLISLLGPKHAGCGVERAGFRGVRGGACVRSARTQSQSSQCQWRSLEV